MDQREPPPIRVSAQHPPDCMELLLLSTFSLSSFSPPRTLLHPPSLSFHESSKRGPPSPTHPAARAKLTLMIMKLLRAVCACVFCWLQRETFT